jgi:nucleoside-diphosphate-sugar epimerase
MSSNKPKTLVTGGSGFIGSHLIAQLNSAGHEVLNVDIQPLRADAAPAVWCRCSILDPEGLVRALGEFQPRYVIHLAAHAAMGAKSLDEFRVNTDGTANLLRAVKACPAVERLVVTSSQHVRKPGHGYPAHDTDYVPYEFYGESKVITERLVREIDPPCAWTIIRPTAVWGSHQPPLADSVWKLINQRRYFHPSHDPVMRSYGYVRNVVWQINRILEVPAAKVNRRVLYVGDENIRQQDWIHGFAKALTGRPARTLPIGVIRWLAHLGDLLRAAGLSFPIYASRFYNLTTPNPVPIEPTFEALGRPPVSLEAGIRETTDWLKTYYRNQHEQN